MSPRLRDEIMGFLKDRINGSLENRANSLFDVDRCEALRNALGRHSIESEVAFPGTPGHVHKSVLNEDCMDWPIVSSLSVRGRSFEFLELWETHTTPEEGEVPDSLGGKGRHVMRYWHAYIVPVPLGENRKFLYAGMYRPDDQAWISDRAHTTHHFKKGEASIAERLNSDPILMRLIIEDPIPKQTLQVMQEGRVRDVPQPRPRATRRPRS